MASSYIEDLPESGFTDATIKKMYLLADAGKTDEKFQKIVYGIVNRSMRGRWKAYRDELSAIFEWFKNRHDYRRDPHNVELVQDVFSTMDRKRFDCDDACIWLCAAAEILGAPCRFVTVSTRHDGEPSHVFVEAFVGGRWEPMDASVQFSTFGWAPAAGVRNKKIWSRADVGLSGYEERPHVEGLGMHDSLENSMPGGWTDDGYHTGEQKSDWEGGFARNMFRVKPEGVSDDISNTFAPGMPGSEVETGRTLPSELVNSVADDRATVRPDDPAKPYPQEYPIASTPSPTELDYTLPRRDIPMPFDPNVWNGSIPTWGGDPSYMLPIGARPEADYMDYTLSGYVGDHDVDWKYMDDGAVDRRLLGDLSQEYAKLSPQEKAAAREEYRRLVREARAERKAAHRTADVNYHALQQAAHKALREKLGKDEVVVMDGLGDLGSIVETASALAKSIGTMVTGGQLPKDTNVINQAIDVAATVAADKLKAEAVRKAAEAGMLPPGTVPYKPPAPSAGLPGWVIPAVVVAGIAAVGFAMSRR